MVGFDPAKFDTDEHILSDVNDAIIAAQDREPMVTRKQWKVIKSVLIQHGKLKLPDVCEQICLRCHKRRGEHLVVRSIDRDFSSQEWLMCPEGRYQ